ncbi:MAG: hypothetical protein ACUVTZ_09310 [Armatimonadota bacterium]
MSERPWWVSAVSHSCSAIAGAAVAMAVVAATVGLHPREKVVEVPVYRTAPQNAAESTRGANTNTADRKKEQEHFALKKPKAQQPPAVAPFLLPPMPVTVRPLSAAASASGVRLKVTPKKPAQEQHRASPEEPPEPASALVEGLAAAERGDVDRAINLLERASAENPKDPVPLIRLGELYERKMTASETVDDAEKWRQLAREAREKASGMLQAGLSSQPMDAEE